MTRIPTQSWGRKVLASVASVATALTGLTFLTVSAASAADTLEINGYDHTVFINDVRLIADKNPGDGVCDTGEPAINGFPDCTLYAAIQEANAYTKDRTDRSILITVAQELRQVDGSMSPAALIDMSTPSGTVTDANPYGVPFMSGSKEDLQKEAGYKTVTSNGLREGAVYAVRGTNITLDLQNRLGFSLIDDSRWDAALLINGSNIVLRNISQLTAYTVPVVIGAAAKDVTISGGELLNQRALNGAYPSEIGFLIIDGAKNITIKDLTIANMWHSGVQFAPRSDKFEGQTGSGGNATENVVIRNILFPHGDPNAYHFRGIEMAEGSHVNGLDISDCKFIDFRATYNSWLPFDSIAAHTSQTAGIWFSAGSTADNVKIIGNQWEVTNKNYGPKGTNDAHLLGIVISNQATNRVIGGNVFNWDRTEPNGDSSDTDNIPIYLRGKGNDDNSMNVIVRNNLFRVMPKTGNHILNYDRGSAIMLDGRNNMKVTIRHNSIINVYGGPTTDASDNFNGHREIRNESNFFQRANKGFVSPEPVEISRPDPEHLTVKLRIPSQWKGGTYVPTTSSAYAYSYPISVDLYSGTTKEPANGWTLEPAWVQALVGTISVNSPDDWTNVDENGAYYEATIPYTGSLGVTADAMRRLRAQTTDNEGYSTGYSKESPTLSSPDTNKQVPQLWFKRAAWFRLGDAVDAE